MFLLPSRFARSRRAPRRPGRSRRSAAAAVELALILPLLGTLVLGMFELGRGLMVKEMLSDAAQKACRTAALPGKSNADVLADVTGIMADSNVSGYATIIKVNGNDADVSTAQFNDQVSVQVSVPVSSVFWTTTFFLPATSVESEKVVMLRQG